MTPEEIGKANAEKFIANADRFGKELKVLSAKTGPANVDLEQSFKASFIAKGHSPEKAAVLAKLAKDGHDYEQRGL